MTYSGRQSAGGPSDCQIDLLTDQRLGGHAGSVSRSRRVARSSPDLPRSLQYDLFTQFFGRPENLSNTIELWDAVPKYSCSARQQSLLRDAAGRLPVYTRTFEHRPLPKADNPTFTCTLSLQPASIVEQGRRIDCYPSMDEELIEEVLRKIFTDQACGLHDPRRGESWVRFSLHMIRTELSRRGRTRSIPEIKRSLEIMSKTVIDVTVQGRGARTTVYTNPILNDLVRVTRADLADDPAALWMARLPGLVSACISTLGYRQFNYAILMDLDSALARWLHKRLSHGYTNAHLLHPYQILLSTIGRDSGLLHACRTSANLKAIDKALDELVAHRVLLAWKPERRHEGRAIADVLYTLTPHTDFVAEIKAANARASDARDALQRAGLIEAPAVEAGPRRIRAPVLPR